MWRAALAILLVLRSFHSLPAKAQAADATERILENALALTIPAQIEVSRDGSSQGLPVYRFTGRDNKLLLLIARVGDSTRKVRAPRGASAETLRLPGLLAQSLTWSNAAGMRFGEVRVRWDAPGPPGFAHFSYGPLSAADASLAQQTIRTLRRAPADLPKP
ncbi:MAG TPA: hypothetical protein VJQ47_18890 [Steroidobacteraceae bacterium]|nr:hypothetical protein [Steroidobacteraceae bacterium]